MSTSNTLTEITLHGTIKPDGTLELDQKPKLSPGPVTVVLRQETNPATQEGWWPYMLRVRAEREAAGYHFMNEAEMEAHLQGLRQDDDRIDHLHQEIELEKRRQENI